LKDVVYFEKWNDKENKDWESIQKMIKENLDYA
jgi:5,6-dimethylbenzimidazole synthase